MLGTVPDLLRLLAVPVLGYAAWRDVRTRRVPNVVWYPLYALGVVLLVWEGLSHLPPAGPADTAWLFRVAVSLCFVAPLSYLFWRLGGFGGADAKAFIALAVLVPTFPRYYLATPAATLPAEVTTLGVFSMTVLTNTVLLGVLYPVALGVRNALSGSVSPAMFLAHRVPCASLPAAHGRLFEDRKGFTRSGLDLDALRMYLRWRGTTLRELRSSPAAHRDPASVTRTYDPTDGAVYAPHSADGGVTTDGGRRGSTDGSTGSDTPVGGDAPDGRDGPDAPDGRDGPDVPTGRDAPDAPDTAFDSSSAGAEPTTDAQTSEAYDDPWAAQAFIDAVEGSAYGTSPERLREGLETVSSREEVWVSPGIPFIVPTFVGVVVAFVYGDLLFGLLSLL